MKRYYLQLIAMLGLSFTLSAQEAGDGVLMVKEKSADRVGKDLVIKMKVDVSNLQISKNQSLVCTPLIELGDSVRPLPPVIVNGKTRHVLYQRLEREKLNTGEVELKRKNNSTQVVDYMVSVPYADWMKKAEVSMIMDDCGCGWENLSNNKSPLFALNFAQPVVLKPALVYVKPQSKEVKARHLDGSAYLDFPVNQTTINPDYRNNYSELQKIRKTIDAVREDQYATITDITIKGFASPEGSYAHNGYLAENRARALADFVKNRYGLSGVSFQVDFVPEDWDGLEKAVQESSLYDKDALLAIIQAAEPADWDAREWKLKTLNGGAPYRILLRDIYPSLRHSDYRVNYVIRDFSLEEAKAMIHKDPSKLSLNEMLMVAEQYPVGSDAFNEVFEIAVRMYPEDAVSNLNAAVNAVNTRQLAKAKRYLNRAEDSAEKKLVEAAILMLEDKLDEAKAALNSLKNNPSVQKAVQNNLKQIELKECNK